MPSRSCWIQYASGPTGFPKGATLSHHNILNNGFFVGELCGYTEVDPRRRLAGPAGSTVGRVGPTWKSRSSTRTPGTPCRAARPASCAPGATREIEEFGVSDVKYGEELMAWVRMRPGVEQITAEALREFCAGKLAHYKIPRYVHVVEDFPMTVTGKVRTVEMRGEAVGLLGLGDADAVEHA